MRRVCGLENCERPYGSSGYCQSHARQMRAGLPFSEPRRYSAAGTSTEERIERYTERTEGCWEWRGAKALGYGVLNIDGATVRVHRFVFESKHGQIPDGMVIDHMCHNPSCVRIDHLQAVSNKQNGENLSGAHCDSSTGVRGVSFDARRGKYRVRVGHNGRERWVGYFANLEDANAAAVEARNELFDNNLADAGFAPVGVQTHQRFEWRDAA